MARNTTAKATSVKAEEKEQAAATDIEPAETINETEEAKRTRYKPKAVELDPSMYVPVRNGFNGKLIYKSRKTGERYVWERFGEEQDVELRELRAAKTSYKAFYENNWFLIDDPAVIEYLGVERFYKNALSYKEFDTIFTMKPEEIEKKISGLSHGQKSSLTYRAKQMIGEGGIDSIKVINTLERALGVELIERHDS